MKYQNPLIIFALGATLLTACSNNTAVSEADPRKGETDRRRVEDDRRRVEDERRRAEDAQRRIEDERRRVIDETWRAEDAAKSREVPPTNVVEKAPAQLK